ncbi:MAG: GntR family transcriptional regulator [Candidatus Omnitrophica bacterium]|nr:GntR family transcriptional regulator [Candidatus Omnitrophota bacterium]MCM8802714.1 GntR family transcriptional regulator [Candidatus Omnitrophota bacterium]
MSRYKKEKPIYLMIYEAIKKDIEEGKIQKGELIYPEEELTKIFRVSRVTIRKALELLLKENYIKRKKRYGTEVIYEIKKIRDEKAIGVLLVDITRPFFNEILKGIQQILDLKGYKLILCDTENNNEKEKEYIMRYKDNVAGFIIAPSTDNRNLPVYAQLLLEKVPFVFIDRYLPELNVDCVTSDNFQGGYIATKHLIELGHKNIGVITELEASSLSERIEGYRKALEEAKINSYYIFRGERRGFKNGYEMTKEIIKKYTQITGIFCLNDEIALGCIKCLQENKIKIPDEISVIGYDNLPFSSQIHPTLTTIEQKKIEIGKKSAEILIEKLEKTEKRQSQIIKFPVEFINRESTSKCRKIL